MFIREIIQDATKVIVITRPRRFGKTFNLSMLHYFLAKTVDGEITKGLFDELAISKDPKSMAAQGKYPVVFLSLKSIKGENFEYCLSLLYTQIQNLYESHRNILNSSKLSKEQKETFQQHLSKKATLADFSESLFKLCFFIFIATGKKPYLLIDEYDTPIQEGYLKGYYSKIIDFMRGFLSSALKDNKIIETAVLTGILRISKESLFSDLNNVEIYSVLEKKYSAFFGFTELEIEAFLKKTRPSEKKDLASLKQWYNGYQFGDNILYNPWSILKFIKSAGKLEPYWVNTSRNRLIEKLIIHAECPIKEKIARLISGKEIHEIIDEHLVFLDLDSNKSALWSLFLMSGYLNAVSTKITEYGKMCTLLIPNKEILFLLKTVINRWLSGTRGITWYIDFLEDLKLGRVVEFEEKLQQLIEGALSYHDNPKNAPELFFHGLTLGLTAGLSDHYEIQSNRESGLGRFDLAFFPKSKQTDAGILIEFKAPKSGKNLAAQALKAKTQIQSQDYAMEMRHRGIQKIIALGIAFYQKQVKVA